MYDTIHTYLHQSMVESVDLLSEVPCLLDSFTISESKWGTYCNGHIKNMRVNITEKGISIKGSLSKFYFGSNAYTLSISDTKKAIDELSEALNLPLYDAKVTRIDFGTNFIVDRPVISYYPFFGDCRYLERFTKPYSLYYQNNSRSMVFYDKIEQLKSDKLDIPNDWQGENVIRYEIRFTKRLAQQLKEPQIIVSTLFDESFYSKLSERYFSDYQSIFKISKSMPDFNLIKTPTDYRDQIVYNWIKHVGVNEIIKEIESLKKSGSFKNRESASRAKSMIKGVINKFSNSTPNNLIDELNSKIYSIGA